MPVILHTKRILAHFVGVILLLAGLNLTPALAAVEGAGKVITLTGSANVVSSTGDITRLSKDALVYPGDVITTSSNSYARIKFIDESIVVLRPFTRFHVEEFEYKKEPEYKTEPKMTKVSSSENKGFFNLLKGGLRTITGLVAKKQPENYRMRMSVATIGIRGTGYQLRHCQGDCLDIDPRPPDGLYAGIDEGTITITNNTGTSVVNAGEFAYVANIDSPVRKSRTTPRVLDRDPMPPARPPECE